MFQKKKKNRTQRLLIISSTWSFCLSLTWNILSKYKKKTWIDLPRLPRAVSGIFLFGDS